MKYYPFWIGDHARDTRDLTLIEEGAYRRLLDNYYAGENPLPRDDARLYRMVGAVSEEERQAVDDVVIRFWKPTKAGLVNPRAKQEILKAEEKIAQARHAAETRWKKEKGKL